MDPVYRAIVRSPWSVVVLVVVATVVLGAGALRLRVDSSVATLLPRHDPAKQFYDEITAPTTLEKIRALTTRAAAIEGVESVISLTNVRDPIADVLNPPLLIPETPTTREGREALRARIKDNPLFAGNLISPDSHGAAVNIFLGAGARGDDSARRIDDALEALIAEIGAGGPERMYLTGISHIKMKALALMRRDLGALTPASLAFVVLVLFFSFRTRRGVVLPLLCVMVGVIWTVGIMGWVGEPISLGTLVLPPLLIVIGSSYATHVVSRYYLELETPTVPGEPVFGALRQAGLPVMVSGGATIIGFSALMLNSIQAVRSLGLYAVVGITFLFVLAMTLVPALMLVLPERRYRSGGSGTGESGRLLR